MPRTAAVLLAAVALALSACGGSEEDEYVEAFDEVGRTLTATLTGVGRDVTAAGDPAAVGARLDRGAEALDDAADDLDEIDEPDDARTAHERAVAGVEALAGSLRAAARQSRSGDTTGLLRTIAGLDSSRPAAAIRAAEQQLRREGYGIRAAT